MARCETAKHLDAFEAWYASERSFPKVAETFRETERTLRNWSNRFGWHERADKRDMEAVAKAERDAVKRRARLLEDQRKAGETLRVAGVGFFEQYKEASLKGARDAITAIKEGFALERQAEGLPDWVGMVLNASDSDLIALEEALARTEAADTFSGEDGISEARPLHAGNGIRA